MDRVRVVVADDDPAMREALAELIDAEPWLELAGMAPDAEGAIGLARRERPDVALLDVKMPFGGGARAAREIRAISPLTRIVALSAYEDRGAVLEMLQAGAVGYLVKGSPVEEILDGIRRTVRGQGALSGEVTAEIMQELTDRLRRERRDADLEGERRARIHRAIDARAISMVFQPIAELRTGRVLGLEALARFASDPPRPPNVWFDEAAAVGLRTELELAAIACALEALDRIPTGAYLSLNVSPETMTTDSFHELLGPWPTERVVVEVTEHARVEDYEALARGLRRWREIGGRLAVDDAGAGFASLRHILRLDPDIIKLDLSLTRGVDTERSHRALASALAAFAREVGVTMVAEGIETRAELNALLALGISCGQGYFLARPGPLPAPSALSLAG